MLYKTVAGLLAKGDLEKALQEFSRGSSQFSRKERQSIILLQSRYAQFKREKAEGIHVRDELDRIQRNIEKDLLELAHSFDSGGRPEKSSEHVKGVRKGAFIFLGILLLGVSVWKVGQMMNGKSDEALRIEKDKQTQLDHGKSKQAKADSLSPRMSQDNQRKPLQENDEGVVRSKMNPNPSPTVDIKEEPQSDSTKAKTQTQANLALDTSLKVGEIIKNVQPSQEVAFEIESVRIAMDRVVINEDQICKVGSDRYKIISCRLTPGDHSVKIIDKRGEVVFQGRVKIDSENCRLQLNGYQEAMIMPCY